MKCRSALEEYCLLRRGICTTPNDDKSKKEVTNAELHELLVRMRNEQGEHLREQDLLLDIIRNQSKPQFWREVLSNTVGNFVYEGLVWGFKCLKKF